MPTANYIPILVMGVCFFFLGLLCIWWGKREERAYYDSLTSQRDLREFLNGWPRRIGLGAITLGGWISLAVGFLLLVMGVISLFRSY